MGIFDVFELFQHIRAIDEYLFYADSHRNDLDSAFHIMQEHLNSCKKILEKLE